MLGLDYETDADVQAEFDYLDKLKAKYTEQEIYNSLMEEDIDFEISNLKYGGANTLEAKDMLAKLREAKAHKDFADEDNQLENWEEKYKDQEEETLYF